MTGLLNLSLNDQNFNFFFYSITEKQLAIETELKHCFIALYCHFFALKLLNYRTAFPDESVLCGIFEIVFRVPTGDSVKVAIAWEYLKQ